MLIEIEVWHFTKWLKFMFIFDSMSFSVYFKCMFNVSCLKPTACIVLFGFISQSAPLCLLHFFSPRYLDLKPRCKPRLSLVVVVSILCSLLGAGEASVVLAANRVFCVLGIVLSLTSLYKISKGKTFFFVLIL